jgi:hypothetical protein
VLFSDDSGIEGNPSIPRGYVTYWRSYLGMGILYLIIMTISVIIQIVQVTSPRNSYTFIPITGFWTAPFIYAIGVLSICLSKYRSNYGLLVGTMVMCIVAAVILAHISLGMWITEASSYGYYYNKTLPIFQIIFCLIIFITLVVQASFTCYDCCWCCVASRNLGPTVVYSQPTQSQGLVTIVTSQPTNNQSQTENNGASQTPDSGLGENMRPNAPLIFNEFGPPEDVSPYSPVTMEHSYDSKPSKSNYFP